MFVRAKVDVYLSPEFGGYKKAGESFDYAGPVNEHLEPIDKGPYADYGTGELKDELTRRGIEIPPAATPVDMSNLLAAYDQQRADMPIEPKAIVPAEAQGSGTEKYGASDWTDAGQDADGFPVAKGTPTDVSKAKKK